MVPNIPGIPGPPLGGSSSGSSSPSGYNLHNEAKMVSGNLFTSIQTGPFIKCLKRQELSPFLHCSHMADSFHNKYKVA